ncbi:transmembrane protein 174 [Hyla sarda]|uniref:transmembrane protein 174 n=1 Tax=Hyla sarda TaxID=327740 RepID=UPI0024C210E4|nr:transmembrane protein 174 [Hyla sarda]
MEQNNHPVDDFSLDGFSLPPYANSQPDVPVSEGDKAGATLLFSGFFMGLVGITLTIIAWLKRDFSQELGWAQMMGPILISVGVTFILISVCRYKVNSCRKRTNTTVDTEQSPAGQSFVFTGINQPITFHGATVLQYIPPPYTVDDVMARDPSTLTPVYSNTSSGMVNGVSPPIFPPQYYSIYPQENPAFIEDEESSQPPDHERSPVSSQHYENHVQRPSEAPPLYDDLYPHLKIDVQAASHNS